MVKKWHSRDRVTVWEKEYRKTTPEGRVCLWTVKKVKLLQPKTHKVIKSEFGMRVVPGQWGETQYYTFQETYYGGSEARGDALNGFCSGRFRSTFESGFRKMIIFLADNGFKLAPAGR